MRIIDKLYIEGDIDINTIIDLYILYKKNKIKLIITFIKMMAQRI